MGVPEGGEKVGLSEKNKLTTLLMISKRPTNASLTECTGA
jgi:hypothetical protein